MLALADAPCSPTPSWPAGVAAFVARLAPYAPVNSLGEKLVQLTMPGVPDVYQGCELAGFSLVDPDNRRPVDYAAPRASCSPAAQARRTASRADLDGEKLLVTSRALRLRREHPDWFAGGYEPLAADGPAAEHALRSGAAAGGHRRHPAARRPGAARRLGRHAPPAAGGPLAGRAHRPVTARRRCGRCCPTLTCCGPAGRAPGRGVPGRGTRSWASPDDRRSACGPRPPSRPRRTSPAAPSDGPAAAPARLVDGRGARRGRRHRLRLRAGRRGAAARPALAAGSRTACTGPAARYDHAAFAWTDAGWRGRRAARRR